VDERFEERNVGSRLQAQKKEDGSGSLRPGWVEKNGM